MSERRMTTPTATTLGLAGRPGAAAARPSSRSSARAPSARRWPTPRSCAARPAPSRSTTSTRPRSRPRRSTSATASSSCRWPRSIGSDDIAVCADADVVVVHRRRQAEARPDAARPRRGDDLPGPQDPARRSSRSRPNAVYVMVTNPVDVVTYAALKISGPAADAAVRLRHGAGLLAAALPASRSTPASRCRTCTRTSPASTATPSCRCGARRRSASVPLLEWNGDRRAAAR